MNTRGARNGNSKLKTKDVKKILIALRHGELQKIIAKQNDITQSYVSKIKRRERWSWLVPS
jgi:hypothetical protein